jgi:hypothetical protein
MVLHRGKVIMLAEVRDQKEQDVVQGGAAEPKAANRSRRVSVKKRNQSKDIASLESALDVASPSDALGSDAVKKAGNREMLVFAQNESALLRRQEAVFQQASAWIARVPEDRREGVRQAVMVYASNVRSWQLQTQEQETAFLSAQDKDQQARVRFMLAEKALSEAAQKKRFGLFGLAFRKRRIQAQACMEQASEHAEAVREALNEQGLAIHRYLRFESEWRKSIEEMLAFVAEQSGIR